MLCYYPHALFPCAYWLIYDFMKKKYQIRFMYTGANIIFWVPILRRIMVFWGCVSVSAEAMKEHLQSPYPYNCLMLQPDGIRGMFYGIEHEQIVLERRRGFCRIALQTGASLVPCYVFGANQFYWRRFGPDSFAARLSKKLRVSIVYWSGYWGVPFGCVPVPTKLVVAIGAPILVTKTAEPTKEQIDELHSAFVKAIKDLYDCYKHKMGVEWAQSHDRLYLETDQLPSAKSD